MSTTVESVPVSQNDFESQLDRLLDGLKGHQDAELTHEFVATYLLQNCEDRSEDLARITKSPAQAYFENERKLLVTKGQSEQPSFDGKTVVPWVKASTGTLVATTVTTPTDVAFFARDDVNVRGGRPGRFDQILVIFFYNFRKRVFAVFVGKPNTHYNSGRGVFTN